MAEAERKQLPPYMPYRSFLTFLESLRSVGIPSHIDKGAMGSMSGAMQSWTKASMRAMRLIDDDGVPQPTLRQLVESSSDARKDVLATVFRTTYSGLEGKIDLTTATMPKLKEAVGELGAQGETIEKVIAFLVAMSKDAGVPISAYLTKRAPRRSRGSRNNNASTQQREQRRSGALPEVPLQPHDTGGAAMKTIMLTGAKGRLTLSGTFNIFDLGGAERDLVFTIIDKMKEFEAKQEGGEL